MVFCCRCSGSQGRGHFTQTISYGSEGAKSAGAPRGGPQGVSGVVCLSRSSRGKAASLPLPVSGGTCVPRWWPPVSSDASSRSLSDCPAISQESALR